MHIEDILKDEVTGVDCVIHVDFITAVGIRIFPLVLNIPLIHSIKFKSFAQFLCIPNTCNICFITKTCRL